MYSSNIGIDGGNEGGTNTGEIVKCLWNYWKYSWNDCGMIVE